MIILVYILFIFFKFMCKKFLWVLYGLLCDNSIIFIDIDNIGFF